METELNPQDLRKNISDILTNLTFDLHNKVTRSTENFISGRIELIQQILFNLKSTLEQYDNVDKTLTDFPDLCHFLGRLNQISVLALNPTLSMLITECTLKLYVKQPTTHFEQKAKSWVLFQIRNAICLPREQEVLFEHVGNTSNVTYQKAVAVLNQQVTDLKNKTMTFNGYLLPCASKVPQHVDDICRMLIFLIYNKDEHFLALVDTFMDLFSIHSDSEPIEKFFKKITELQTCIYTDSNDNDHGLIFRGDGSAEVNKVCLNKKSLLKLWTSYLPSLEQEILALITQAIKKWNNCAPTQQIKSLIESRHLPQSCAMDYQLFHMTTKILHSLTQPEITSRTSGRQAVLTIISLFYDSVHENLLKSSRTEETFLLSSLYPSCLMNFVKHFQIVFPCQDLVSSPLCIKNLSSCIQDLYNETCGKQTFVKEIWLYTQHFTLKLLPYLYQQLFILPKKHIPDCLYLLIWFYQPLYAGNQQVLSTLSEIISNMKTIFKSNNTQDLKEGLSKLNASRTGNIDTIIEPLIRCLVLTCFMTADEHDLNWTDSDLMELVSGFKNLQSQAMFLLSAQTILPLDQPKMRHNYLRSISICREKLQLESDTNDTNPEVLVKSLQACTEIINAYSQ